MKMDGFDYEELEAATESFSPSRLIGKGSHGCVYRGILKDGKLVAIKKPSLGLRKLGDNSKLENEVRILSSLPRKNANLINLLGTSQDCAQKKVLVMEYMPNGNLHDLLHVGSTSTSSSNPLTWTKRVQMTIQVARAVQFLHESKPSIIHRDIKSANILFDSDWNAKLADFGLAVRQDEDGEVGQLVDSPSRPAGTIGYLDPYYTTPCKLSTKNDVFSFGVVLLEIISCTKAIDVSRVPASIVEWALPLIEGQKIEQICDKKAGMPLYIEGMIRKMLQIAASCVSPEEDRRPSMGEIVVEIENCFVERDRFPIWMNILYSLLKRQRNSITKRKNSITAAGTTTTTTTTICAAHGGNAGEEYSERKMLLREVLADVTLK